MKTPSGEEYNIFHKVLFLAAISGCVALYVRYSKSQ